MIDRRMLLLGGLALGACGRTTLEAPFDQAAADRAHDRLASLHEAALAAGEKEIVVFSTTGPSEWEPLWRAFARAFPGFKVVYSHVSPNQVTTRINAETASGRRFGDLFIVPINIAPEIAARGYFQPWRPPHIETLPTDFQDDADILHYPFGKVFGLAYNTRLLSPERLPGSIEAVLAPEWRRGFSYIEPGTVNGTTDVAIAILRAHGRVNDDQLHRLRQAGSYGAIEAGVTYVSQGRQKLQLWAYLPTVRRQHALGAPVEMAFVPDFSTMVPFAAAISRNVVRPHAARLLKAWLFTDQAQAVLARQVGMFATLPGAPLPHPGLAAPQGGTVLWPAPPTPDLTRRLRAQLPGLRAIFDTPLLS